jgi:hypothetical protein
MSYGHIASSEAIGLKPVKPVPSNAAIGARPAGDRNLISWAWRNGATASRIWTRTLMTSNPKTSGRENVA